MRWVVGNWKMVRAQPSVDGWLREAAGQRARAGVQAAVAVPSPYLFLAAERLRGSPVAWGGQDVSWDEEGAHTGEVSASMLAEAGSSLAIVGHSERRLRFGETDAQVAAKALRASSAGIRPLVCVGELAVERRDGRAEAVVAAQVDALLVGLKGQTQGLMVAYEPIWAIGTGVAASPADAETMHGVIRSRLGPLAGVVPVLYGGSVSAENAGEFMAIHSVDGVLVGGGSLHTASFFAICDAAERCAGV
jgi:triosephosphate isomerase